MLLPGLFFMTVYPFARARAQQSLMREYRRLPVAEQQLRRTHVKLNAELDALFVTGVPAMVLFCVASWKCSRLAASQGDPGFWKPVIAGTILIIVNASLAFAGCSLRPAASDVQPRGV